MWLALSVCIGGWCAMKASASGICEFAAVVVCSRLSSAPVDLEDKINNIKKRGNNNGGGGGGGGGEVARIWGGDCNYNAE